MKNLEALEQAEQQSKLGLLTDSEEVHQEALQRLMGKYHEDKMDIWSQNELL